MSRRCMFMVLAAAASIAAGSASAQETIKIGAVQSMTGSFNQIGKQAMAGARLYVREHGDAIAGRKIEIVLKDDTSRPDIGRRLAQELIVNDKVALLLGGITPSALTVAPLTVETKIPMIVAVSGASITVERSPYTVRTSFTPRPILVRYCRVGDKERSQKNCNPGQRLDAWPRSGEDIHRRCGQERRRDRCRASGAVGESRFCAVSAAYSRSQT